MEETNASFSLCLKARIDKRKENPGKILMRIVLERDMFILSTFVDSAFWLKAEKGVGMYP